MRFKWYNAMQNNDDFRLITFKTDFFWKLDTNRPLTCWSTSYQLHATGFSETFWSHWGEYDALALFLSLQSLVSSFISISDARSAESALRSPLAVKQLRKKSERLWLFKVVRNKVHQVRRVVTSLCVYCWLPSARRQLDAVFTPHPNTHTSSEPSDKTQTERDRGKHSHSPP